MSHPAGEAQLVARFVAERAGTEAAGPRFDELVARVARTMAQVGATSAEEFQRSLERDAGMFEELVVSLTVGESYFFRESAQIDLLRRRALPERAAARGAGATLRLWSAGCAAGQEAYTLAMVLAEEGLASRAHVLATDISLRALELARRGVYGKWSLRALEDWRLRTYFRQVPGGFEVDRGLARAITFRQHNLVDSASGRRVTDMDVVLCRNVLVYLTPAALESVSRALVEALAPGGWLVTASTDPSLEGVEGLHTVVTPEAMAYRRRAAKPAGGERRHRTAASPPRPRQASQDRSAISERRRPVSATAAPGLLAGTPAGPSTSAGAADGRLAAARQALAEGEYEAAATTAAELVTGGGGAEADVILVRALGSAGHLGPAADAAAAAIARFPVHVELRLLHAIVSLESANASQAAAAARAAAYLDPHLAMAHLTLARAEEALGDTAGARRSYRNALAVLEAMPAEHPVPLADGETAGRLAGLARAGGDGDRRPASSPTGA